MSPRADTAATLLLLAGLFTVFLGVLYAGMWLWYGRIRPRMRARFQDGKIRLAANCDRMQAGFDDRLDVFPGDEIDDDDAAQGHLVGSDPDCRLCRITRMFREEAARKIADDAPARLAFTVRDRVWMRRAGIDIESEAQR